MLVVNARREVNEVILFPRQSSSSAHITLTRHTHPALATFPLGERAPTFHASRHMLQATRLAHFISALRGKAFYCYSIKITTRETSTLRERDRPDEIAKKRTMNSTRLAATDTNITVVGISHQWNLILRSWNKVTNPNLMLHFAFQKEEVCFFRSRPERCGLA